MWIKYNISLYFLTRIQLVKHDQQLICLTINCNNYLPKQKLNMTFKAMIDVVNAERLQEWGRGGWRWGIYLAS